MFEISLPIHDPVLIFALVMMIVLIAPLLFARLRVPGLVGLIVCGAVVGPSGLGLLERDSTMILLGTVGLLYLMFVAGLALDLNQFRQLRNRSILFGLLSFLVPLGLAIGAGRSLLGYTLPAALLVGSVVGSHTLLAYPVANRLGITKNTAIVMTMGGTIVTDLLALLLLAVVAASTEGALDLMFWIQFLGLISVYLGVVLLGLPRLARWFLRSTRSDPNVAFVFLVTALFVTAYLAGLAGLAPIIGAFLAGLVLNRLVPEIGPLMSRVKFVGEALFIPFFLLSVGMLVNFSVLAESFEVWRTAAVFTALVIVGKGIAAQAVKWRYGYSTAETWAVFGLSVPQAAATLAVTLVGFNLGLFDQTGVNAVVVMILITCLLGPWLVERYGRRVAMKEEERPYQPSEAPQRVLIPLSNPATSSALVDLALAIRRPDSEEPIFPLAVVRDGDDVAGQVAAGEKLLSHAVVHTVAADVPVTPMTRVDMDVARGIARAMAERRISHVVIGWGGQSSARQRIFGSILDRLLESSRETVLVCRLDHPINTVQRVVLAVPPLGEREPGFDEALRTVKRLASRIGASLTIVAARRHLDAVERHARAAKPDVPLTFVPLASYNRLLDAFTDKLLDKDIVVVLSARENQLSWRPSLDRLPRLFAQQFPEIDFVAAYPSTQVPEQIGGAQDRGAGLRRPSPLPPVRATRLPAGSSPAAALHEMMEGAFSDRPHVRGEIASQLLGEEDLSRLEITSGVILFHAHTALVSEQMLFAGISDEGISFETLPRPARVVLILLNPADLSPEEHLTTLAHLARIVHHAQDANHPDHTVRLEVLIQELNS